MSAAKAARQKPNRVGGSGQRKIASRPKLGARKVHPVRLIGRGEKSLRNRFQSGRVLQLQIGTMAATSARKGVRIALRLDVLLPILIFLISLGQNLDQVHVSPFFRDEARWVGRSFFLEKLADPFGPTWNEYYLTTTQAPFANYVMGVGLLLQGHDLDVNRIWDFNESTAYNQVNGAMPSASDLTADRRMNAVIGALVTLCVYVIGRRIGNRVGAVVGACLIAFNPLHILMSSQALADEFLTLCIALIYIVAMRLARHPSWQNATLLGVLIGIGGSTKLSPLLFSLPLAALGVLLLIRSWRFQRFAATPQRDRRLGLQLLAQPFIGAFVFVAVYPYLWVDPIRRTYDLFTARTDEMTSQGNIWTNLAITGPLDVLAHIGKHVQAGYSTSYRLQTIGIHALSSLHKPLVGLDFFPAIAGALVLAAWVVRSGLTSRHGMVAILMASDVLINLAGMRADFNRYYLPVVLIIAICTGVCASSLWATLASSSFLWRVWNIIPGVHVVREPVETAPAPERALPERGRRIRPRFTPSPRPVLVSARMADEFETMRD